MKIQEWPSHVVYAVAIVIVGVLLVVTLIGFKVYDVVRQDDVDFQRQACLANVQGKAAEYEKLNGKIEGDNVRMPLSMHKFIAEQKRNESELCIKLYPPK